MEGRIPTEQPEPDSRLPVHGRRLRAVRTTPVVASVDVVIPVFNEERALPGCVAVLHEYLTERLPFDWVITIVDNASDDNTLAVADELAERWPGVRVISLRQRGKGRAVRTAWANSVADVVAYMDVDLSTGLDALPALVAAVATGHSDIAIGSRLVPGSRTIRGAKRELISRCYNALLRLTHRSQFHDAQCGFKVARANVVRPLLSRVKDDTWFFDTELLLLAEHNGLRVLEVPVDWVEDVDSRVDVGGTAVTNVRGLLRLAVSRFSGAARVTGLPFRPEPRSGHPDAVLAARDHSRLRNLVSFCLVGAIATVMTLGLYTVFRSWWPPLVANLLAVTLSTLFNTEANRRFTFGGGSRSPAVVHLQSLAVFGLYCGFTSGALLALHAAVDGPPRWAEIVVLLVSSGVGTLGRFALLSTWVFRPAPARPSAVPPPVDVAEQETPAA